jgi:hypothetical protein
MGKRPFIRRGSARKASVLQPKGRKGRLRRDYLRRRDFEAMGVVRGDYFSYIPRAKL